MNKINKKINKLCIFLFTRDLRLNDNIGLIESLIDSYTVLPCFILNDLQIKNNEYKSNSCIQFMCESLIDLNTSLLEYKSKLFLYEGNPVKILKNIVISNNCDAIYINRDYTKFAVEREESISLLCKKLNIKFKSFEDHSLLNNLDIKNDSGEFYKKFTPFYNKAIKYKVDNVIKNTFTNYLHKKKIY